MISTTQRLTEVETEQVEYIQSRHSPDEDISLRDQVDGPLSSAASESDGSHQPQVVVRETVREKTEVLKDGVSVHGPLFVPCSIVDLGDS